MTELLQRNHSHTPQFGLRHLPSQIKVGGGLCRLVAEPMSPAVSNSGCYQAKCDYKSGVITTARLQANDGSAYRYSFTYGYVESRTRLTSKNGFFTAFWMLPNDPNYSFDGDCPKSGVTDLA